MWIFVNSVFLPVLYCMSSGQTSATGDFFARLQSGRSSLCCSESICIGIPLNHTQIDLIIDIDRQKGGPHFIVWAALAILAL